MAAKIVFLDIERQAGVAEGIWQLKQTGWLSPDQILEPPRTICFAWKWLGQDKVHFAAEWQRGGHKRMVEKAHSVLDTADLVVGWNSKSFDSRHLRSEILLHEMHPPSPHKDVDLMLTCKRHFGFLSNRMSYIAAQLGAGSKLETGGGQLWRKLRHAKGDDLREARNLMQRYNEQDVLLTEELYHLLLPWIPGLNLPVYRAGNDDLGPFCPACESSNIQYRGVARTLTRTYRRFQCNDCGRWGRDTASIGSTEGVPL